MKPYHYVGKELFVEKVALSKLAQKFGTPLYVYSESSIIERWQQFADGCRNKAHLICYAVKANSNLAIIKLLAKLGAGFDIVSGGELARVLQAGGDPKKIIFSGVGKSIAEITAALKVGIHCFNVESEPEIKRIQEIAEKLKVVANVSFRINPDVEALAHPYIATGLKENKFGIELVSAKKIILAARKYKNIKIIGIGCHIGSQITNMKPFLLALSRLLELIDVLTKSGVHIKQIDMGGGLGICYKNEKPIDISLYLKEIFKKLKIYSLKLILEPGRMLVGESGALLTKVEYLKTTRAKNFAIVDAGMNDLIRPSLYSAYHEIMPVQLHKGVGALSYDVVGPVCETGDFLGLKRKLAIKADDLLVVANAGAYGFSLASHYNSRPNPAEVLVKGNRVKLVRARETYEDLWRHE